MNNGKKICAHLKVVRKQIADANDIPYEITECPHQGPCAGTCPKCESELRYIENQLSLRRAAGKAVSLVGLSLGISSAFMATGCTSLPNNSEFTELTAPSDSSDIIQGMMLPPDSTSQNAAKEPGNQADTTLEECIMGDIEIDEYAIENTDSELVNYKPTTDDYMPKTDVDGKIYYLLAEKWPEFPGGETALMDYFKQKLRYPAMAGEIGLQGRVTLSFIVEEDGAITNINVLRSPGEALSNEAIHLVKSMPKWTPGKIKDTPVRVKYVLPLTFKIES